MTDYLRDDHSARLGLNSRRQGAIEFNKKRLAIGLGALSLVMGVGVGVSELELFVYNHTERSKDMAMFNVQKKELLQSQIGAADTCMNATVVLGSGVRFRKDPDAVARPDIPFPLNLAFDPRGDISGVVPSGESLVLHDPLLPKGDSGWIEFHLSSLDNTTDNSVYPVGYSDKVSNLTSAENNVYFVNLGKLYAEQGSTHKYVITQPVSNSSNSLNISCQVSDDQGLSIESNSPNNSALNLPVAYGSEVNTNQLQATYDLYNNQPERLP